MRKFLKKYTSHIILIILVLFIIGSALWSPGGILLLDYILTPYAPVDLWQPLIFPLLNGMTRVLGYTLVSKIFFVLVLIAAAYLGALLARMISKKFFGEGHLPLLEVLGATFFLINPFAYERMMVQPTIYAGIIAIGYGLYFLVGQKYIWSGVSMGVAWILFPHASFMIALIYLLYGVLFIRTKKDMLGIIVASWIILFLNLNWILAPVFGVSNSVASISSFSLDNLEAFRTQALAPMNVWMTNTLLYGFWGEQFSNHYASVSFLSIFWYIAGFGLIGLMAIGKWRMYSSDTPDAKKYVWFLGLLGFFSLIFGIGIASPITAGLTEWMITHISLWQGYREPQKWIGLLMIVEAIFFLWGLSWLLEKYGKDMVLRISIILSVLILFLIWSPGPIWGYHGQLRTTVYPTEFDSMRESLLSTAIQHRILALPWHSYLGCSWTGRPTIANPITGLLAPLDVIVADNIEAGSTLYSNSKNPRSSAIEQVLASHDIAPLASYNIHHILLMKECADSTTYLWIDQAPGCQKVTDNSILSLYQCQK